MENTDFIETTENNTDQSLNIKDIGVHDKNALFFLKEEGLPKTEAISKLRAMDTREILLLSRRYSGGGRGMD